MTSLDWTDVLDIGLPQIDEQHKQLFNISNDLLEAIGQNKGEMALHETFDRLRRYAAQHFKEEESFMQEIGYPELKQHASEHSELLAKTLRLEEILNNREGITPDQVADFISDWIVDHIMYRDSEIGAYAKSLD